LVQAPVDAVTFPIETHVDSIALSIQACVDTVAFPIQMCATALAKPVEALLRHVLCLRGRGVGRRTGSERHARGSDENERGAE
jgi:hypothetical protein